MEQAGELIGDGGILAAGGGQAFQAQQNSLLLVFVQEGFIQDVTGSRRMPPPLPLAA